MDIPLYEVSRLVLHVDLLTSKCVVYHSGSVQYFHSQWSHLYLDTSTPPTEDEVFHFSWQGLCHQRAAEIKAAFSYELNVRAIYEN